MDKRLERILPRVQKPARYVGGEYNAILKDKAEVDTRIAFCFPDTYEIGMSNLGMRILYGVMNNIPGVWCERVFAPWGDMEAELRQAEMPLFALESGDPITDYDIVAFSVGYEMAFPAILNMLDLAHIPLHAADRTGLTPLVIAGGTAMYNAEPLADFIDLVSLGEGEDVTVELVELHRRARREGWSKADFLRAAEQFFRCSNVHIPLVKSNKLNYIGIFQHDFMNFGGRLRVLVHISVHKHSIGAAAVRLFYIHCGTYSEFSCLIAARRNHAAFCRKRAYYQRFSGKARIVAHLYRGKKRVHIHMNYFPFTVQCRIHLRKTFCRYPLSAPCKTIFNAAFVRPSHIIFLPVFQYRYIYCSMTA